MVLVLAETLQESKGAEVREGLFGEWWTEQQEKEKFE